MEKKIDIRKKYSIEVTDIENKLYHLDEKLGDDSEAQNSLRQIQKLFDELTEKIEYNRLSDAEVLQQCIGKAMDKSGWGKVAH